MWPLCRTSALLCLCVFICMCLIRHPPVCLSRCARGRETCCCVRATVTEPSTLSVSASQWLLKGSSTAVNAAQVSVAWCDWIQPEDKMFLQPFPSINFTQKTSKRFFSLAGIHHCFVCKTSGDGVKRCMIPLCGKFYHTDCVQTFSATQPHNKGFRCPLHVCLSCHVSNPLNSNSKGIARTCTSLT